MFHYQERVQIGFGAKSFELIMMLSSFVLLILHASSVSSCMATRNSALATATTVSCDEPGTMLDSLPTLSYVLRETTLVASCEPTTLMIVYGDSLAESTSTMSSTISMTCSENIWYYSTGGTEVPIMQLGCST